MTEQHGPDTEKLEAQINDLLEGRLEAAQAEQLKRDAEADHALATAIIDAYQLHRAMEDIGVERAPASLRRKLRRIPAQHKPAWQQPRWILAYAAVPLMVLAVVALQPRSPSQAEIEQARQDLAVAFAYLDQVTDRTREQIQTDIGGEMTDAVAGSIFKSIYQQNSVMK